jgi:hypothetical protein
LDTAIEGFKETDVEDFDAIFDDNKGPMSRVEFTEEADTVTSKLEDDKIAHEGIEICPGHVSGGNITAFVGVNHDGEEKSIGSDGWGRRFKFVVEGALRATVNAGATFQEAIAFFCYEFDGSKSIATLFEGKKGSVERFKHVIVVKLSIFLEESNFGVTTVSTEALAESKLCVGAREFRHLFGDVSKDKLNGVASAVSEVGEAWC